MAAPISNEIIDANKHDDSIIYKIEATVVTGFERIAKQECIEKFGSNINISERQGRVIFELPFSKVHLALDLHSAENVYLLVHEIDDFAFSTDKTTALLQFRQLVKDIGQARWNNGLAVWREVCNYEQSVSVPDLTQIDISVTHSSNDDPHVESHPVSPGATGEQRDSGEKSNEATEMTDAGDGPTSVQSDTGDPKMKDDHSCQNSKLDDVVVSDRVPLGVPRFRATCYRTGKHHSFGSPDAACEFGGAINDFFRWKVDLKNFDIEVVLNIEDQRGYVTLALTKATLGKRNINHFGPTTLKSTIAYCMLRMSGIKDGDVVCDPMGGGGSIPIEGAICWPNAHFLCGDNHGMAESRVHSNVTDINQQRAEKEQGALKVDMFRWDVKRLPLHDSSVDVFITDMPFGKRMGNKFDNRRLYPQVLTELARVARPTTGRAVMLTQDKKCIQQSLIRLGYLWRRADTCWINIGGLSAGAFLLYRTANIVK
ncbi:PREDICTED: THUMP domain-containing protein 3-like [Priapulus caudatus]|uniref:THUMP domain-containing protein 3-like n=1 Tax=Priapulus caudatus TaxID=37621 RepID=A0ABM1EWQ3_PRICU|nr:PREDICTED: THUMP domain-containing protein 3-like [Priapulus caudatus]